MFIASIKTNRVKRTRKHLRRCCRSKRRWTFKCTQTRNQHRFTTTNPKPVKIHVCFEAIPQNLHGSLVPTVLGRFSAFLLNLLVYSTCVSGCRRADSGVGTWYHFIIIDLLHWYLNLGRYCRALRGECRVNTTSFLSPLFLKPPHKNASYIPYCA